MYIYIYDWEWWSSPQLKHESHYIIRPPTHTNGIPILHRLIGIITNKKWTNDVVKISLIHEVNIHIFHSLLFGCPLSQDMFLMRCHPPPHLHSESGPCHQPTRFHQSGRLRKQNKQTRWTTTTNNQTSRRSGFCWGQKLAKKKKTNTLWLCQNSYWKWPFIVSFPIKNGDFP